MLSTVAEKMFDDIAARLVVEIEEAQRSGDRWRSPWVRSAANGGPSSIDGHGYRGSNLFSLMMQVDRYPSGIYGTYKAWARKGVQVQGGERGTPVAYWKRTRYTVEGEADEERTGLWCKVYTVFAAEQTDAEVADLIEGRKARLPNAAEQLAHASAIADAFFINEGVSFGHGGNRAFYNATADHVQMPPMEAFKSTEGYYGILLHEMVHATGHKSRLEREFGGRFGDKAYAFEELVAEIGSAFLCAATHVTAEPRPDHAKYLASWLAVLKDEQGKAILTATSAAQKAADLVLSHSGAEEEREAA